MLALGILRFKRRIEPVRTRALLLSKLPTPLLQMLTLSEFSKIMYLIGLSELTRAEQLLSETKLSSSRFTTVTAAMAAASGRLSYAIEVAGAQRGLARQIAIAAHLEIENLKSIDSSHTSTAKNGSAAGSVSATRSEAKTSHDEHRIIHVIGTSLPDTQAGYTIRTQYLLRALSNQGVTNAGVTRLLYPVDRGLLNARDFSVVDSVTYYRELPKRSPKTRQQFNRTWAETLIEIAKASRARLLHPTTDFPNGRAALAASATLNVPCVYEVRGFLEESALARLPMRASPNDAEQSENDRYELSRRAETEVMQEVQAVTTLSETMKSEITSRGIDPKKVHVMPNGIPAELLTLRTDKESLRSRLGIAKDQFIVGLITTFAAHEGIPTLVEATKLLRARGVPVTCVLVGNGPTWHATKRMVTEGGGSEFILLPGRIKTVEIAQWYQLLDLFVIPRIDARVTQLVTPLKPLEAMALGVPVLGSDVSGIASMISEGVTGALFPPDDPIECANKIEELLYDSAARRSLADAGRAWIAQERTWAMIAKRYVGLYQELGAI